MIKTTEEQIKEIYDRVRRVETRLTSFFGFMGFETNAKKPIWTVVNERGTIIVPTDMVALKEILATVPEYWDREVEVWCKGNFICRMED